MLLIFREKRSLHQPNFSYVPQTVKEAEKASIRILRLHYNLCHQESSTVRVKNDYWSGHQQRKK